MRKLRLRGVNSLPEVAQLEGAWLGLGLRPEKASARFPHLRAHHTVLFSLMERDNGTVS